MEDKPTKTIYFEMSRKLSEAYSEENKSFTCPVCNKKGIKNVFTHFSRINDIGHNKFMDDFHNEINQEIDKLLPDFLQMEINEKLRPFLSFLTPVSIANRIRNRAKKTGVNTRKVLGTRREGSDNPVHNEGVREKISASVAKLWEDGNYADRINGMYNPEIHEREYRAEYKWREFLAEIQDVRICSRCGSTTKKTNVHHIDEDHSNFLPSNLEPLCICCHTRVHGKRIKRPFVILGKEFYFAAAHQLPNHKGMCKYLHGHEWKIRIELKKRIDHETGMVMDFSDLKKVVNDYVISILDHSILNETLYNPTAENLLIWIWEHLMFDGLLKGIYRIHIWESRDSIAMIDVEGMLSVFKNKGCKYL